MWLLLLRDVYRVVQEGIDKGLAFLTQLMLLDILLQLLRVLVVIEGRVHFGHVLGGFASECGAVLACAENI